MSYHHGVVLCDRSKNNSSHIEAEWDKVKLCTPVPESFDSLGHIAICKLSNEYTIFKHQIFRQKSFSSLYIYFPPAFITTSIYWSGIFHNFIKKSLIINIFYIEVLDFNIYNNYKYIFKTYYFYCYIFPFIKEKYRNIAFPFIDNSIWMSLYIFDIWR